MPSERTNGADWRDAAAYAPLLGADRSLFAWEWLRRDPLYVAAVKDRSLKDGRSAESDAARFGLAAFERPGVAVPEARPLWAESVHPFVLAVERGEAVAPSDAFDLERFGPVATLIAGRDGDHLLLSDGSRALRLDAPVGLFRQGPVALRFRLEGLTSAERPLLSLRRFLALCRDGRFSDSLHPREARARRWILMLRAHDAMSAGASQREIAGELFSNSVAQPRWRSRESSVRSQVQRLVQNAREMARGRYRCLLL